MSAGIAVIAAGPCDTVQDRGRHGLLAQGFSPSGAMDQRSAFIANALVGNVSDCAVLEFAYAGPTLRFDQNAVIALAGAPFEATLGPETLKPYRAYAVRAGSVLRISHARAGVFGYLAVHGGIDVPAVLGSRSTSMRYGIGGVGGRRLRAGDHLPLTTSSSTAPTVARLDSHDAYFCWRDTGQPCWIRVVVQDPDGVAGWAPLFAQEFTVDAQSDRMGMRLLSGGMPKPFAADLVSEALALGTVQVPASANPIVAMADRQTTGGYFKAGVVAGVDLPRLTQCRPGTRVRFEPIGVATAQQLLRRDARYLRELGRRLRG